MSTPVTTAARRIAQEWHRNRSFIVWFTVLVLLILVSIAGPWVLPSPSSQELAIRLQGPSLDHVLGTDDYGRDILSRVVSAGRISLGLSALIKMLAVGLGSVVGLVAGFYTGTSSILMRIMDSLMAFPAIVLAIALVVALSSKPGALAETIALTVVFTPYVARVVRSRALTISQRGFVTAARAAGVRGVRILVVHVLPNALPTIMVQATFVCASALLADASLSFLGLGVAPPTPTWGNMIADAKPYISSSPLFIVAPGTAIVIAVMAFNLAGDGIRSLVDPRAKAVLNLQALERRQAKDSGIRGSQAASPPHQ